MYRYLFFWLMLKFVLGFSELWRVESGRVRLDIKTLATPPETHASLISGISAKLRVWHALGGIHHTPHQLLMNTIVSFVRRVLLTLSHRSFHRKNKAKVIDILRKNNFDEKAIKRIFNKAQAKRVQGNSSRYGKSYPFLERTSGSSTQSPGEHNSHLDSTMAATHPDQVGQLSQKCFSPLTYVMSFRDNSNGGARTCPSHQSRRNGWDSCLRTWNINCRSNHLQVSSTSWPVRIVTGYTLVKQLNYLA